MFRILSGALCVLFAISPLFNQAEAQLTESQRDPRVVDGDSSSSGVELGCQTRPTTEEITQTIENVRRELRKLGDWGLKPLWDDVIKKWLEEIGATDLPSAFGLLCSSSETLDKLVQRLNGTLKPPARTRGVIDEYFAPDEFGPPFYMPDKLPKLKELIERLEKSTKSTALKEALKQAKDLIERLEKHFTDCGGSAAGNELLLKLFEEFKKLIENLIKRPDEKISVDDSRRAPAFCTIQTSPELALM
jgi:hypothetical protein